DTDAPADCGTKRGERGYRLVIGRALQPVRDVVDPRRQRDGKKLRAERLDGQQTLRQGLRLRPIGLIAAVRCVTRQSRKLWVVENMGHRETSLESQRSISVSAETSQARRRLSVAGSSSAPTPRARTACLMASIVLRGVGLDRCFGGAEAQSCRPLTYWSRE